MPAALKARLFEAKHQEKLENPNMGLEEWVHVLYSKPTKITIEKKQTGKKNFGGKIFKYVITQEDPLWPNCQPSLRSRSDFIMLQKQLELRFPTAIVPHVHKEDNMHLMEMYLQEIAKNPFFRMDVAFVDFVDGKLKEYKQTKKKDKQQSEGTLRWLQQVTEYKGHAVDEVYLKRLKTEFDQLERNQKGLVKSLQKQVKALNELQVATNVVSSSLGEYSVFEQTCESSNTTSIAGEPTGRLRSTVGELMKLNKQHYQALGRAYDGEIFKRLTIDPILFDLQTISSFKKLLDQLSTVRNEYFKAKYALDANQNEAGAAKAQQNKEEKEIIFEKQKNAFSCELEKFKTFRTLRFQNYFVDYVRFNIRAGQEISSEWTSSGISLDAKSEEEFNRRMRRFNSASRTRSRGISLAKAGPKGGQGATDTVTLRVTTSQNPRGITKYIKVVQGELVSGYKGEGGDWYVTTSTGQKGYVRAANVAVQNISPTSERAPAGTRQSAKPPPGLATGNANLLKGEDVADDWSVSDDGGNHQGGTSTIASFRTPPSGGNTLSRPHKPSPPSLPPGLTASQKVAPSPMLNALPPRPPSSRGPPNLPAANMGVSGKSVASSSRVGFGNPGSKPEAPAFRPPPSGNPPQFGAPQAVQTPSFRAVPPASKPLPRSQNAAPKLKPSGGGLPPRSFLADIKRGKQANNLKKVPDAEKSKEIGGSMTTSNKVNNGGSGGRGARPPAGGVMGELAAKLNSRR